MKKKRKWDQEFYTFRLFDIIIYLLQKFNVLHILRPAFEKEGEEFQRISKAYQDVLAYGFESIQDMLQYSLNNGYQMHENTKRLIEMAEELIKEEEKELFDIKAEDNNKMH